MWEVANWLDICRLPPDQSQTIFLDIKLKPILN